MTSTVVQSSDPRALPNRSGNPRFLVLAPQGFGDCIEATPLVHALRTKYERSVIDVVVTQPTSRDLFVGLQAFVDEVIYLPYWEHGLAAFALALLKERRRDPYDVSFLVYPAARWEYQLLLWLFRSRKRIAHAYGQVTLKSLLWLHDTLVPVRSAPNALRNLDLLQVVSRMRDADLQYLIPDSWRITGAASKRNTIALHVGTTKGRGCELRRWPVGYFAKVAAYFIDTGFEVVAICGPDDVEAVQELCKLVPRVEVLRGALPDIGRQLSSVRLLISNDSGIAHLGGALGIETIVLFGPTPVEHALFGANVHTLRPSLCPPCFDLRRGIRGCVKGLDFQCIKERSDSRNRDRAGAEGAGCGTIERGCKSNYGF